jgi:hypothetical protein
MRTKTVSMCNTHDAAKRVPITMTAAEDAALAKLATKEQRSKSAMARIIYQLGLKAYATQRKAA